MNVPKEVLDIFNEIDPPVRKRKISNEEVLKALCFSVKTGLPWRYLSLNLKCNWSTIYKRFQNWTEMNAFEKVFSILLEKYSKQQLTTDPKWFKELFIDTSMIKNVSGVDGLGKNPTDRGRLATKMSVIVDHNIVPVSCVFYPANVSDFVTAIPTVDAILCPIKKDKRYTNTIVGDKGYVSKNIECELKSRKMKLLTPRKRNMKFTRPLSQVELSILGQRHKIENCFCRLDKFKKIHCRHEKLLLSFKSMTFFAMTIIISKYTDNHGHNNLDMK